mmetsp:Transcript_108976/g.347935  ORF Transcript_108976/g.347935 Transcript_108976/m.347935 type:complete len:299 (+) Transcript_108976:348-1244(+)
MSKGLALNAIPGLLLCAHEVGCSHAMRVRVHRQPKPHRCIGATPPTAAAARRSRAFSFDSMVEVAEAVAPNGVDDGPEQQQESSCDLTDDDRKTGGGDERCPNFSVPAARKEVRTHEKPCGCLVDPHGRDGQIAVVAPALLLRCPRRRVQVKVGTGDDIPYVKEQDARQIRPPEACAAAQHRVAHRAGHWLQVEEDRSNELQVAACLAHGGGPHLVQPMRQDGEAQEPSEAREDAEPIAQLGEEIRPADGLPQQVLQSAKIQNECRTGHDEDPIQEHLLHAEGYFLGLLGEGEASVLQ